jgi:hypothetical protein
MSLHNCFAAALGVSSGAKATIFLGCCGAAEAVPFQSMVMKQLPGLIVSVVVNC